MTLPALLALLTAVNLHTQQVTPISVPIDYWHSRGNCVARAEMTQRDLVAQGVQSTIWIVAPPYRDRDGHLGTHAVVVAEDYVADSNLTYVDTREEFERDGYRFLGPWIRP